jgi:hypothetical protein
MRTAAVPGVANVVCVVGVIAVGVIAIGVIAVGHIGCPITVNPGRHRIVPATVIRVAA